MYKLEDVQFRLKGFNVMVEVGWLRLVVMIGDRFKLGIGRCGGYVGERPLGYRWLWHQGFKYSYRVRMNSEGYTVYGEGFSFPLFINKRAKVDDEDRIRWFKAELREPVDGKIKDVIVYKEGKAYTLEHKHLMFVDAKTKEVEDKHEVWYSRAGIDKLYWFPVYDREGSWRIPQESIDSLKYKSEEDQEIENVQKMIKRSIETGSEFMMEKMSL